MTAIELLVDWTKSIELYVTEIKNASKISNKILHNLY